MVDAAIGGKCGLDFEGFKNHIGLFKWPEQIFCFPDLLNTLAEEEWLSGKAEMIKHALISDADLWEKLVQTNFHDHQIWINHIEYSANLKMKIVRSDQSEQGERKKLNFGHTIGHALESLALNKGKGIPHGIAVAAGMIMETELSFRKVGFDEDKARQIQSYLTAYFPKVEFSEEEEDQLLLLLQQDKKNRNGALQFSLLSDIGDCLIDQFVDSDSLKQTFANYRIE
jgi:3-dehydroquinate synthase